MEIISVEKVKIIASRIAMDYLNKKYAMKGTFDFNEKLTLQAIIVIIEPIVLRYIIQIASPFMDNNEGAVRVVKEGEFSIFSFIKDPIYIRALEAGIYFAYHKFYKMQTPSFVDIFAFVGENYAGDLVAKNINFI